MVKRGVHEVVVVTTPLVATIPVVSTMGALAAPDSYPDVYGLAMCSGLEASSIETNLLLLPWLVRLFALRFLAFNVNM